MEDVLTTIARQFLPQMEPEERAEALRSLKRIAPGCVLTTVDHPKSPAARRDFTSFAAPITIGRDVRVGVNCTVFPGVTIGDNVIVGANSVVNRDVPSNCVVAGAPIRVIREIEDDTGAGDQ